MPSEKQVETRLVDRVRELGGRAWKLTVPGVRFVPDRLLLFPGGIVGFAELKGDNGRIHPAQQRCIDWLISWGFKATIIWNYEQIEDYLNDLLNLTPDTSGFWSE